VALDLSPQSSKGLRSTLAVYERHLYPKEAQEAVCGVFSSFRFPVHCPLHPSLNIVLGSLPAVSKNVNRNMSLARDTSEEVCFVSQLGAICSEERQGSWRKEFLKGPAAREPSTRKESVYGDFLPRNV
jgi:hypothetical protein